MDDINLFPGFDYTPISQSEQRLSSVAPLLSSKPTHIKFGIMPKVDHTTGTIIYLPNLRPPAFGTLAQRRVQAADESRVAYSARCWQYEKRHFPKEVNPMFQEVRWEEELHPGIRVPCPPGDGEDIASPKTRLVNRMPPEMAANKRVQDERPGIQTIIDMRSPSVLGSLSSASTAACRVPLMCCVMQ